MTTNTMGGERPRNEGDVVVEWERHGCGDALCMVALIDGRMRAGTFRALAYGSDTAVQWWARGPRGGKRKGGIERDIQAAQSKAVAALDGRC